MNTQTLLLTILGSAAVGALVSSLINAFDRWRERAARDKEMLFKAAVEISKATGERAAKTSERFVPGLELMIVEKAYEVLKQVHEKGKMSEENRAFLTNFVTKRDTDTPKE